MEYDDSQRDAIDHALDPANEVSLITGGAGTGKTTIIKRIADELGGATVLAPTWCTAALNMIKGAIMSSL